MRADAMREAALKRALTEALGSVYADDLESGYVGADAERAQIVAWLRGLSGYPNGLPFESPTHGEAWVLHRAADAIEAGQHWRADDDRA